MTKTCAENSASFTNVKNGHAVGQPHRRSGIRDRTVKSAQARSCGPGGSLQADQIHPAGDTNHVSRFQNGSYHRRIICELELDHVLLRSVFLR